MISGILLLSIGVALIALFVTAALSPIETLSWWAGWTEEELRPPERDNIDPPRAGDAATQYIVYLSGVASLSGRFVLPRERAFLKQLKIHLPDAVIIDDVFPYSPAGLPLLESPRIFERVWRFVQKMKLEGRHTILAALINFRNVFQVMVSADHRYGPIFNQGAATIIETALARAGYRKGVGAPITIIGYSGGGQIAIGAAAFLASRLKAPIDIYSIGGVMASDPGLHFVRRLHHFFGDKDGVQRLGAVMFPERWPLLAHSEWNLAKRDGRIALHPMRDMRHAGPRGYFGLVKFNGRANSERTLDAVTALLRSANPSTPQNRCAND